jgi:hypothetical protein
VGPRRLRDCASRDAGNRWASAVAWGASRVHEAGESGLGAREGGSPDSAVSAANGGDGKPWPGAVSRWLAAAPNSGMGFDKSQWLPKWLQQILKGGPIVFDFGREPVQFGHLLKHMPRKDTGDEHTDFGWELLRNMTWYVNVQLKDSRNALAAFDWRDTVLTQSDLANPRPRAPTRLWNQSGRIDKVSIVESMLLVPTLFEAIDTKIKISRTVDQRALGSTSSRLLRAVASIAITHADVAEGLSIHGGQCTICAGFLRIGIHENEDPADTGRIDAAALSINRSMEVFPEFEVASEFYELRGARALHTALNCRGNVSCTGCNFLEGSASLRRGGGRLANLLPRKCSQRWPKWARARSTCGAWRGTVTGTGCASWRPAVARGTPTWTLCRNWKAW